jgi:hypothetical protein
MKSSSTKSFTPPLPCYVGITGVQSPEQVERLIRVAASYQVGRGSTHALMLGCLVSPSLEHNRPPINTSKPYRHVDTLDVLVKTLAAAKQEGCVGMLHFELGKVWPGQVGESASVISLLKRLAAHGLHPAVQLNGAVRTEDIHRIGNECGVPIVLQLRKELAERDEAELLNYINSVEAAVSMILLDPSAGAGHEIKVEPAVRLQRTIETRFPGRFSFGYAGGLGGATTGELQRTTEIVQEIREALRSHAFSVDVESRVRRAGQVPGTDELDLELCSRYFESVMAGF